MLDKTRSNLNLYIVLISVHGLIRSNNLELGKDADTGGQIKYLIELSKALIEHPDVKRVDLLTRQVFDSKVDLIYSQASEIISPGATIFRIPCGPRRYLRKEVLWPHLDSFADQALLHIREVKKIPDVIHSHYADSGFIGAHLAGLLGIPLIHTGHSLGRDKLQRLLANGSKVENIEKQYNITQRIEAEEYTLDVAEKVIASTKQEINEQYQLYDNYEPQRMCVIPPGIELKQFFPPTANKYAPAFKKSIDRFLENPNRPIILALARADLRKNVKSLIEAYGQSTELQKIANLVILLGTREDVADLSKESREVFNEVLYLIDKYDLYGKISYPKFHHASDIPQIYRLASKSHGVFINPALTEPFGLTIIEAAASGLPVVATKHGGPAEIIENCKNGLLIDPLDKQQIASALLTILSNKQIWTTYSKSGIFRSRKFYSWNGHVERYVSEIKKHLTKRNRKIRTRSKKSRLPTIDRLIVCDIDDTLIGNNQGLKFFLDRLKTSDANIGLGVATGRNVASAIKVLKDWEVPNPDVLITSVGTEIKYGPQTTYDHAFWRLIQYRWDPAAISQAMKEIPGIRLQVKRNQSTYKISYLVDPSKMPTLREIKQHLRHQNLHANVIYSHQAYLDILPMRASKGAAVRYVADKWGIPLEHILVAGDSGNDTNMLLGDTLGVVVANHNTELRRLKGRPRIYFSKGEHAWGINEAMDHYNFLGQVDTHDEQNLSFPMSSKVIEFI